MSEPIDTTAVPWQEWRHNDEIRVQYKVLHDTDAAHMGVCIQALPAGCSTRPAHYHLKEEEHVYVLKGRMNLRLGKEEHALSEGHYVCFPAGEAREHCLMNPHETPCEYLLWGERCADDIVVYPDSNKVSIRALGEIVRREPLDYWDGES